MREKFWDLAGSKMGKLLKIQSEKVVEVGNKNDEVDYRSDNRYASSLIN